MDEVVSEAGRGGRPAGGMVIAGGAVMAEPDEVEYTLKVREGDKRGLVTVGPQGITRIIVKWIGKGDRQFIPFAKIHLVEHNRNSLGPDVVVVHAGANVLEWKVARDALGFVELVNDRLS